MKYFNISMLIHFIMIILAVFYFIGLYISLNVLTHTRPNWQSRTVPSYHQFEIEH